MAAAGATPTATSRCCGRSPTSPRNGIGLEGVRRILDLQNRITALATRNEELVAELEATREALRQALTPRRTPTQNRLPVLRQPDPAQSLVVWRRNR